MPIAFQCPACSKQHRANESLAGKQARCTCGQVLTVPQPAGESPAPSPWDQLLQSAPGAPPAAGAAPWTQPTAGAAPYVPLPPGAAYGHAGAGMGSGTQPGGAWVAAGAWMGQPAASGRRGDLPAFSRVMFVIDACCCTLRAPMTLISVLKVLSGGRVIPGIPAAPVYTSIVFGVLIAVCGITGNVALVKKQRWGVILAAVAILAAVGHLTCMDILTSHQMAGQNYLPFMVAWDVIWAGYHVTYAVALVLAAKRLWGV